MVKKEFFRVPSAAEMLRYSSVRDIHSDLIDEIFSLEKYEAGIIKMNLIPERFDGARKFMKHGPEVKIPRIYSMAESIERGELPYQLLERAFNERVGNTPKSGYTIRPFIGGDKTPKKISLYQNLEGSKIVRYCNSDVAFNPRIGVKPYSDARGVERDGAQITVKIPSRTRGQPNHKIRLEHVVVYDSPRKFAVAYNLSSRHDCANKFFNFRYKGSEMREYSAVENFCAHDFAAYMGLVDYFWNREKNLVPIEASQLVIPTQLTVDFYNKLDWNCLIQAEEKGRPRRLNMAEKEILLWGLVSRLDYDKTFFARRGREGKLKDYDWGNAPSGI